MKYFWYIMGWIGVVVGVAGISTGNGYFMTAGGILLFVYSIDARRRKEEE